MNYLTKKEKLNYLIWLIEKQSGDSIYLARKLNVSKSTIKRMIYLLNEDGKEIQYSRFEKKYKLSP